MLFSQCKLLSSLLSRNTFFFPLRQRNKQIFCPLYNPSFFASFCEQTFYFFPVCWTNYFFHPFFPERSFPPQKKKHSPPPTYHLLGPLVFLVHTGVNVSTALHIWSCVACIAAPRFRLGSRNYVVFAVGSTSLGLCLEMTTPQSSLEPGLSAFIILSCIVHVS